MKVAVEELEACKRRLQGEAQRLIPEVYRQALAETQLHPVEDPDFHDVTLEEGAPLKFTAVVEIKPAIALGTYTGVTVQHAPVPVTDEDLEKALEHLREQHAEFRSVERPAAAGDLVIVDYTLTPEGLEPRREQGDAFLVGSAAPLSRRPPGGGPPGKGRRRHGAGRGGEGEGAAGAGRRVRQGPRRVRDPRGAEDSGPERARGAAGTGEPPGAGGEGGGRAPGRARVPGARDHGPPPGCPSDRARPRADAAARGGSRPDQVGLREADRGAPPRGASCGAARAAARSHRREGGRGAGRRRRGGRGGEDSPGQPAAGAGGPAAHGEERRPGGAPVLPPGGPHPRFSDSARADRILMYTMGREGEALGGWSPSWSSRRPAASGRSTSFPGSSRNGSSSCPPISRTSWPTWSSPRCSSSRRRTRTRTSS